LSRGGQLGWEGVFTVSSVANILRKKKKSQDRYTRVLTMGTGTVDRESIEMDQGFNRVKECRYGMMAYNIHDTYVGRSFDLYGEFSEGEVDLLRQIIRRGDVVVDIGANIGAHTLFMAKTVGPQGMVLAFEPQRIVYQTLCANMALNSIANAFCHQMALGEAPGSILVPSLNYSQEDNYGGVELGRCTQGEAVEVRRLDAMDLSRCRMLKVDVEGMEIQGGIKWGRS
jgi:FkbM family methyltransferase